MDTKVYVVMLSWEPLATAEVWASENDATSYANFALGHKLNFATDIYGSKI